MNEFALQKAVCDRVGSDFLPSEQMENVGIALDTLGVLPLNALRHHPEVGTCGWYIWGGETLSEAPDFFSPLHVAHLEQRCPAIVSYLGLSPGWRVLLAPDYEDIWFDEGLLSE